MSRRPAILNLVLCLLSLIASLSMPVGLRDQVELAAYAAEGDRYLAFLPHVVAGESFGFVPAVWGSERTNSRHTVALFRHTFTLNQPMAGVRLQIFADTRYEVWVDGIFRGRGPARFSYKTHEYDLFDLGVLEPGRHVLAVMVQWAPNERRSESTNPYLQARLVGADRILEPQPDQWRVLFSGAWNPDAALLHNWGILGPSELLDMRRLPDLWMRPEFDDSSWSTGTPAVTPMASYQPRSIPQTVEVQIPLKLHESGLLSPGYWIGELTPTQSGIASYSFTLSAPALVTVQVLKAPGLPDPARSVTLNGATLTWQPVEGDPPDLLLASRHLLAGNYTLQVGGLDASSSPWPFAISLKNITTARPPSGQGSHAGRRMLLARPVEFARTQVRIEQDSLNLSFTETPAYAVIDLGRTVHGRLVAQVSGSAGSLIDIGWDERLWKQKRPLPYPGSLHAEWNQTDSWLLDGTRRTLTTIDTRAGRYILIVAWGPGKVQLDNLKVFEERYPVTPYGSFSSDRPLLDQIWKIGVDTLYSNMNDAYADAWRERGQWWGDAHVADHVNQVAFGDTLLLRRGLLLMGEAVQGGRPRALAPHGEGSYMVDYGMLWVQSAHDYLNLTEDVAFTQKIYPAIQSFLSYLNGLTNSSTGLIELPVAPWNETAYIDSSSWLDRNGQTTAVNALYYGTLLDVASIARQIGDLEGARLYSDRAVIVRDNVNRYLYRPDKGYYTAAIVNGNEQPPSPQAQALALAYGVPPDEATQRVADALLVMLGPPEAPDVQIYGMFWVLEGLAKARRINDAVNIVERYFGRMVQLGATTWWENFSAIERYNNSLSHAWGGSPTWFLSRHVLGIRRDGPDRWMVQPAADGLTQVSGTTPLRSGTLRVSWQMPDCAQLTLRIDAPASSSGSVVIPFNDATTRIILNDTLIWSDGRSFVGSQASRIVNGVMVSLPGGRHTLTTQRMCVVKI